MVAATTTGDRFIRVLRFSEGERLEVDARPGHAGSPKLGGELARQGVGAAEVDVAATEVRDELLERHGVEADLVAAPDDLEQPAAAPPDLAGDLVAQDEVPARRPAHDDGDVGLRRQLVEE